MRQGGNTCLIVEEFSRQQRKGHDPRSFQVVTCSGRTSHSLKENQQRLLHFLKSHPKCSIRDLAYTSTARRMHHGFRSAYSIQSTKQLIEQLTVDLGRTSKVSGSESCGPIVFAFTGQGSTYAGMGQQLFHQCRGFRESILSYQQICDSLGLPSVVSLISDSSTTNATEATVTQSQLAIVVLELALAELWRSWGIQPDLLIGHSLGEYSALCVSGVLSVSDTLYLVGSRSSILQRKCTPSTHAMLAVGESWQNVEHILKNRQFASCGISCKNSPTQTVVSGIIDDLRRLEKHLAATGIKTTFLRIPFGFHSAQVEPILDEFQNSAAGIHFAKPRIPVASTLTGKVVRDAGVFCARYLVRQARESVDFLGALRACANDGKADEQSVWIEIGPEAFCLGLIRSSLSIPPARLMPTIKSSEENWKTVSASLSSGYLAKMHVDWKAYHKEYLDVLTLLDLPSYAFDLKDYWIPYKQESLGPETVRTSNVLSETPQTQASPMTTCLQYVIDESFQNDSGSATFVSYTSEPNLHDLIQGHLVDGVALCPASVFCDMAFTAAEYVWSKTSSAESNIAMSLEGLEMTHPVIISANNTPPKIEVKATKSAHESSVRIVFSSPSERGLLRESGGCRVRFASKGELKKDFDRTLHLVRKRASSIHNLALTGGAHRLLKPIVYKLFSSLVRYGERYQGIEEAFLDNGYRESTARIQLTACQGAGHFTYNPYWVDNLVHLAGFVLNGDVTKPDDIAYIATGLDVIHIVEELAEGKHYTCYVSVQDSSEKKDILVGDAYVFSDEKLVAVCAGMCFQRMHKRILATILGQRPSNTTEPMSSQQNDTTKIRSPKSAATDNVSIETKDMATSKSRKRLAVSTNDKKGNDDLADRLLSIVASESGFTAEDMDFSTAFSDIGVDSLMSITIITAAKSQLDLDLPASFFINNPTVKDVRQELGGNEENEEPHSATPSSDTNEMESTDSESPAEDSSPDDGGIHRSSTRDTSPSSAPASPVLEDEVKPVDDSEPDELPKADRKARLVLLQGRNSSTEAPIFLATDGAGSATAYIHVPPLPNGRRMYALESPFMSDPLDFKCSVEDFCTLYVTAIRTSQPHGPYYIGGWSAGAVYAYEISRQLSEMGEKIQFLFLIDMRVPKPMTDALEPTIELIEQAGLVTGIKRTGQLMTPSSTRLKQHLVSTVKALTRFQPKPMDPARRPVKSFMVWAKRGISDDRSAMMKGVDKAEIDAETADKNVMEDEKTGIKGWFFAKRKAFGPNGWDEMVGEIECHTMEADHFSMVQPPEVSLTFASRC